MDALDLARPEGKLVLDVEGGAGVMRQFVALVLVPAELALGQANALVDVPPETSLTEGASVTVLRFAD